MTNTRSPIDAAAIAKASVRMGQLQVSDQHLFWCERRPQEKGRQTVLMMQDGEPVSLLPEGYSARSKVHEYGGGDYRVSHGRLFFVNDADQGLYVMPLDGSQAPARLSCLLENGERRYADCVISPDGQTAVAVQETHTSEGAVLNDLVAFSTSDVDQEPVVLVTDVDFVAAPDFSHDGSRLAWITWGTQEMSWEQSDLWIADWQDGFLVNTKNLSFHESSSYLQPTWSASGKLYYSCDLKGHWEIYCYDGESRERVCELPGECGYPAWIFGCCCFCVDANDVIIAIVGQPGQNQLCRIENGQLKTIDLPLTDFDPTLALSNSQVFYLASHSCRPKTIDALSLSDFSSRSVSSPGRSFEGLVAAKAISFPGEEGGEVHAFYYEASEGPSPLIVAAHGGPTAYSDASYQLAIQFWVSRGYSYLDVNYRGSAGYGRAYRRALLERWGELDASDCVQAARYAIAQGWVDPKQCFIRGGSAGGLTVLNALIHDDVFAAGTSLYGVVDLLTLEEATHKFEASYLISLVGALPEHKDRYHDRSPRYHADQLKAPVLFLQGLKDAVVPPSQVNAMMAAMDKAGKPYRYQAYPEEGHGFRSEDTLIDALNREHAFYQDVIAAVTPLKNGVQ